MVHKDLVSVTLVTYNSGRFIRRCLESVLEQKYPHLEVIVIDNASTDGTLDILEQFADKCTIHYNDENIGFAAAQNQAIAMTQGEWVLALNPDVLLLKDFVEELVLAGSLDRKVGSVCGKLLSISANFDLPEEQLVDSTGIYFTPMLRHLDRGSQEPDRGHYLNFEYVFGATAAAALYRRKMIVDIAIQGEFFDSGLFRALRGRRCRLARSTDGLALSLHSTGLRISRTQCCARQTACPAPRDQHALG